MSAPTLTTPRLILRAHVLADYEPLHAMRQDPKVYEFVGGKASAPQESWFRLMRYLGHWPLMGYGYFAICERTTGRYIGEVGLAQHKRGLHPEFDEAPEAGWVLASDCFGQGYAGEAMTAVLDWFEADFGHQRSVCVIETAHAVSMRLAAKLGYSAFAQTMLKSSDVTLLHRL